MSHKKTSISYVLLKIIAVTLLFISGVYVFYSIRAGMAQIIYYKAKAHSTLPTVNSMSNKAGIKHPAQDNNYILTQCSKAQRLYPYNYRLLAWGAEKAFDHSQNTIGADRIEYIHLAETLCNRGLSLNRYMMPLPFIKMQLLCLTSIKEGIKYWEQYVEWDYWNSYNHAVLAGLYAADGEFGKAMQSLQFIKGTEDFAEANKIVQDYWNADSAMPVQLQ